MNTFRVIREVPADGVQVEAVSILKFLIFRLIDLNVTVLCFDQQIASGASVAFQSFFMDAVTLLDCRDHVGGLSLGPVVSVRVAVAIRILRRCFCTSEKADSADVQGFRLLSWQSGSLCNRRRLDRA